MPITDVQSEQLRLLQAHGFLTAPRMTQIVDYDGEALRWVADNWSASSTPQANAEVRELAGEAQALMVAGRRPEPGR